MSSRQALEELARRELARRAATKVITALRSELFDKQLAVWDAPGEHIAVLCPRRAGKTTLWAAFCIAEAISHDRVLIRIWHSSRLRCKELVYAEIQRVCQRHGIPVKSNDTELKLFFENGSEIRLVGADKDKEAQKKRGDKTWMDIVLESQNFGALLKGLVFDVIDPCLMDERQRGGGRLYLEGTPGLICGGLWYNITGRFEELEGNWESVGGPDVDGELEGRGWNCFRWQSTSNPFMPHIKVELQKIKRDRNWTDETPTFRREWRGLWVNDYDALFYKYNEGRNGFDIDDIKPWGDGWHHVLGWDLGSKDDMALVVWGYHDNLPDLYEAFSWKKPGALSAEVMAQIDELEQRGFNIEHMVADTGGGGRMYVEDVQARFGKTFDAAKKTEKYQHVTLFNDDLLSGHVKVQKGSPLEKELRELPRDPDWDPSSGKPPQEARAFANHCTDASLYSWRHARHYWNSPKREVFTKGSKEATDVMLQQLEERLARDRNEHWLEREFQDDGQDFHDDW